MNIILYYYGENVLLNQNAKYEIMERSGYTMMDNSNILF